METVPAGMGTVREGVGTGGGWDPAHCPHTSPVHWETSPGLAANLSKSALALPAPRQAEEAWGEVVPSPQRPGDGGAVLAPASPQLRLSPSITGPGSLPSWQCRERDHPGPRWVLGERGCLERGAGGFRAGMEPDGSHGTTWEAQVAPSPPTPAGSGEGAQVGSAGMEAWEGASVPPP